MNKHVGQYTMLPWMRHSHVGKCLGPKPSSLQASRDTPFTPGDDSQGDRFMCRTFPLRSWLDGLVDGGPKVLERDS